MHMYVPQVREEALNLCIIIGQVSTDLSDFIFFFLIFFYDTYVAVREEVFYYYYIVCNIIIRRPSWGPWSCPVLVLE